MSQLANPRRQVSGLTLAGCTAVISGVSVFINSYGVHDFHSPAVYTTAKNLVAAVILTTAIVAVGGRGRTPAPVGRDGERPMSRLGRLAAFAYIGTIGGGAAFVLFFTGLARTAAAPAALLHDTLVIFVALVAWVTLHERVSVFNVAAIMALVGGEVMVTGGTGHLGVGDGPLLVLAATLLWSVETVVAKRLLSEVAPATVGVVRMGVGVGVLVGYLALTGALGELGALDRTQWGWAALTGCTLAAYVATWFTALARARVLDVTSVLVGSVVVTAALGWFAGHGLLTGVVVGSTLVFGGVVATVVAAGVARRPERIAS